MEDPQKCQSWITITEPSAIEYYLLLRNRLHFGQAHGTPFTVAPLAQNLDWAASTKAAETILQGTCPESVQDHQSAALLKACTAKTTLDAGPPTLTMPEFMGKLRVWKETTTTSPSGRHLGRYKALIARGKYDPKTEEEQHETFCNKQKQIAHFILSIINACLRSQHVLERWKTIVNVMIFKDQGIFRIHRLRIIHIYEADFNLLLAVMWRKALRAADDQDHLHPGQLGGRPGCEAQALPLMEELKYDISYMSRQTLYNFDNDAKSCYDRIIPSLASLTNRKYGVHRQVVNVHASTLHRAIYKLKTGSKVSDIEYSHCQHFPLYGTGQGSGNSPCIWLFLSSTLFEAHEQQAYGATFRSVHDSVKVKLTMVGFVDDTTGTCNDFRPQTHEIGILMEHDAQVWNDLLYTSGGSLELPKTSYQILQFHFLPNGTPRASRVVTQLTEAPILLQDPITKQGFAISEIPATMSHKTLGHYKSPADPRQKQQLLALTQKAHQLSVLISTSPISRGGADLAYHSVYLPAIKYPLPQSFFSQRVLMAAEARYAGAMIAKCGYNRHAPSAIIYGPKQYGGAGFVRWYTLQGEGQITNFIKHWRTDTQVSQLLRIALSWAQWQAGTGKSILIDTRTPLPHLECRWLASLRHFLAYTRAKIIVDNPFIPQLERVGDQYIMEYALRSQNFTAPEICVINYCRLYLHIATISELFNAQGNKILPDMFACRRSPWYHPRHNTTIQQRPSSYQIKYQWQRLCREWCREDGTISEELQLGPWQQTSDQMRNRRSTYLAMHSSQVIYHW